VGKWKKAEARFFFKEKGKNVRKKKRTISKNFKTQRIKKNK
jgi:hypothetical protein